MLMGEMKSIVPGAKTLLGIGSETNRSMQVEMVARAQWLDLRICNFSASAVQKTHVSGLCFGVRGSRCSRAKVSPQNKHRTKINRILKTPESCNATMSQWTKIQERKAFPITFPLNFIHDLSPPTLYRAVTYLKPIAKYLWEFRGFLGLEKQYSVYIFYFHSAPHRTWDSDPRSSPLIFL